MKNKCINLESCNPHEIFFNCCKIDLFTLGRWAGRNYAVRAMPILAHPWLWACSIHKPTRLSCPEFLHSKDHASVTLFEVNTNLAYKIQYTVVSFSICKSLMNHIRSCKHNSTSLTILHNSRTTCLWVHVLPSQKMILSAWPIIPVILSVRSCYTLYI